MSWKVASGIATLDKLKLSRKKAITYQWELYNEENPTQCCFAEKSWITYASAIVANYHVPSKVIHGGLQCLSEPKEWYFFDKFNFAFSPKKYWWIYFFWFISDGPRLAERSLCRDKVWIWKVRWWFEFCLDRYILKLLQWESFHESFKDYTQRKRILEE